ncbi:MAG: terpene cyclase/mutase family protein [Verrucomicrobiales bacterium]|nr:terpene cyclase/mutase family protein [Verrucomicrobiales bacterium]
MKTLWVNALLLVCGAVSAIAQAPAPAPGPTTGGISAAAAAAGMIPLDDGKTPTVDAATESVIQGAIRYLASKQLPNGSWGVTDFERRHPVAMTAYTLMGFLAAGHLPGEGEQGKVARLGLQYLLEAAKPDGTFGDRSLGQYMYNHGVATIALAELYGQTQAADIKPKLDRAIKLIISSQNPEGGWRYRPIAQDADVSVTVLQVVGLRAAKNAGIDVPQETIERAVRYVKACYDAASGGFTYQPGNRAPGYARTAAAIYSLQVCGLYDDPLVKRGSEYLTKNFGQREWFTYGTFYAVPAQYMVGSDAWKFWYPRIRNQLMRQVVREGDKAYWDGSIDMGSNGLGPIYATAVYVGVLAMPWNYVPIYQR